MGLLKPVTFGLEKQAAGMLSLPPASSTWQRLILQEAYKQVPMLQDLALTVELSRVDEPRGYGYGRILVKHASHGGVMSPSAVVKTAVIPVTIRDRKMDPLDVVMLSDRIFPLSEDKLLDEFQTLSVGSAEQDRKASSYSRGSGSNLDKYITPSSDRRYANVNTSLTKQASLLEVAARTSTQADKLSLMSAVDDEFTKQMFEKNADFRGALDKALTTPSLTRAEVSAKLEALVEPDVVAIRANKDGTYYTKTASRSFFSITGSDLTRVEAEALFGTAALDRIDEKGFIRAANAVDGFEELGSLGDVAAAGSGIYKVASASGEAPALVLRDPIDIQRGGKASSGYLVIQPEAHGFQSTLGGERLTRIPVTPNRPDIGDHGCFVWDQGDSTGSTLPIKIAAEVIDGFGGYEARTHRNSLVRVALGAVKQPVFTELGVVLPAESQFLPVVKERTAYKTPEAFGTEKRAFLEKNGQVQILAYGDQYLLRGDKLGEYNNVPQSRENAEFLLVALGSKNPGPLLTKVATVKTVYVKTPVELQPESELRKEAAEKAKELYANFPDELKFKPEIVKLAAALPPDRATIDTMLALNLLNPDNLRIIREYIPEIEKTASRLAEVLVATRMGLRGDPEPIRLAMHYVRRVGQQLKSAVPENV
jgi:hypothetical protein